MPNSGSDSLRYGLPPLGARHAAWVALLGRCRALVQRGETLLAHIRAVAEAVRAPEGR